MISYLKVTDHVYCSQYPWSTLDQPLIDTHSTLDWSSVNQLLLGEYQSRCWSSDNWDVDQVSVKILIMFII